MTASGIPRPLSTRERAVLARLLAADVDGADELRRQADGLVVMAECGCGCPSIDFVMHAGSIRPRVEASVLGTADGVFLYTIRDPHRGEILGGIEYVANGEPAPSELPSPRDLKVH